MHHAHLLGGLCACIAHVPMLVQGGTVCAYEGPILAETDGPWGPLVAGVWHAKRNKNKDVISRLPDVILQLPAVIIRLSQKSLFYVLKSQRCFQTLESGHGTGM